MLIVYIGLIMKIKIDYYDLGLTIEQPEDISASELLETFTRAMVMMSYHPDSVKNAVLELAKEYENSSNQ
jgi:hypothetical protein